MASDALPLSYGVVAIQAAPVQPMLLMRQTSKLTLPVSQKYIYLLFFFSLTTQIYVRKG